MAAMVGRGEGETRYDLQSRIEAGGTHTTICLRPSRGLRMNLRVRRVTGESLSAMFAVLKGLSGRWNRWA